MHSDSGIAAYITDVIDILIVSFIVYQLLILLRGTRAVQLLRGVSFLVFIWLMSNFLHLSTLLLLIEKLFSVGVIAVIIIFQPELRRALEQLGRQGLIGRSLHVEDQQIVHMVDEVTTAASYLSSHRIGALIVIERKTGLSDYIETGIKLEANISSELLKNIFLPNTPLHDGAVILRQGVLMAAKCYLPLSEDRSIRKEFGTRHRAGIGVSEISDALVVIVSEETGNISLAVSGELEWKLSEATLSARLLEELKSSKKSVNPFWIRKDKEGSAE